MLRHFCLFALSITLFSCQKKSNFTYQEWTSEQGSFKIALPQNLHFEKNETSTSYKNKKVEFVRQTINGRPVYDSFVKKVSTGGKVDLMQTNYAEESSLFSPRKPKFVKIDFVNEINKKGGDFSKISIISSEEIILIENNNINDYLVVNYFDKVGVPYSTFFKPDGTVYKTERQGSQFNEINATVYTDGPKLSLLSEQIIKDLALNPTLSNTMVFVTSESDKKINDISPVLRFDPKDERFDQLQVFYYLNKSFSWMKEYLQVSIPRKIEAVVHVGYPAKTNSAFYFQNKIRIGKGDDINYANMTHDATIVYHESFHALVDHLSRLPFEGEGGSLNEAFADFFTCLLTDRPVLGDSSYLKGPYKRSLQVNMSLEEKSGGLYHDSQIISGLLWEVKEKLGADKAKHLAIETLLRLNSLSKFTDFNKKIVLAASEVLNHEEQAVLQQIMKSRGFQYE